MTHTRRRADTPNPYDGIPPHELTETQRVDAQEILVERYHGRKDRAAWDRRYWRGRAKRPTHTGQIFVRSPRLTARVA